MQHELFSSSSGNQPSGNSKLDSFSSSPPANPSITMDKFLIVLFLLVISYVVVFSWGVERGRDKVEKTTESELIRLKAEVGQLSQLVLEVNSQTERRIEREKEIEFQSSDSMDVSRGGVTPPVRNGVTPPVRSGMGTLIQMVVFRSSVLK